MDDGPRSLAESITHGGGECPIPQTHDRLEECHHWWHEMARMYHEPDAFRWRLGAFVGAARSMTFMLQAEQAQFSDFTWYESWAANARTDPILQWLNENRRLHTHQRGIAPTSWATFRCLFPTDDPRYIPDEDIEEEWQGPINIVLNPFRCTHYYLRSARREDHPHQYTRFWEAEDLPDRELLDVCADIYDRLAALSETAHLHLNSVFELKTLADGDWVTLAREGAHALPCMNDTTTHRTIETYLDEHGDEVWDDEVPHTG